MKFTATTNVYTKQGFVRTVEVEYAQYGVLVGKLEMDTEYGFSYFLTICTLCGEEDCIRHDGTEWEWKEVTASHFMRRIGADEFPLLDN